MEVDLSAIIVTSVVFGSGFITIFSIFFFRYLTLKEKLKMETALKIEEIQARNRFQIESLLSERQSTSNPARNMQTDNRFNGNALDGSFQNNDYQQRNNAFQK